MFSACAGSIREKLCRFRKGTAGDLPVAELQASPTGQREETEPLFPSSIVFGEE